MTSSSIRSVKQVAKAAEFEAVPTIDGLYVVIESVSGHEWGLPTDWRTASETADSLNYAAVSKTSLRRAAGAFVSDDEASDWASDALPIFA